MTGLELGQLAAFLGVAIVVIVTPGGGREIGALLRREAVRRTIEGVTGTVLVALGLRLAAERG